MSENPYRDQIDDPMPDQRDEHMPAGEAAPPKRGTSSCMKIGCGCLVALLLVAGSCAAFVGGFFYMIHQSEPFQRAVEELNKHPVVQEKLGTPIEAGYLFSGNFEVENDDGSADLEVPVNGPKGSGTVIIKGTMTDGEWTFDSIICVIDETGEEINLLQALQEQATQEAEE